MAGKDQFDPLSQSLQGGIRHTSSADTHPTNHNDSSAAATRSINPVSAAEPRSGTAAATVEGKEDVVAPADTQDPMTREYMTGWRLHVLTFACVFIYLRASRPRDGALT